MQIQHIRLELIEDSYLHKFGVQTEAGHEQNADEREAINKQES